MDGAHWNGQRKMKKADKSGGGGHLGCSLSYNSSEYQQHLDININTQGREQTNALIEKCAQTLHQKNYFNFMRYMKMFFAIRNLISTKRINIWLLYNILPCLWQAMCSKWEVGLPWIVSLQMESGLSPIMHSPSVIRWNISRKMYYFNGFRVK